MTFIKLDIPESAHQSQSTLTAPSSATANEILPCSSITHTGLTVNGSGQLVLSSGYTFILMAGHYLERSSGFGTLESQWYDVTNSQFLGRSCKSWVNTTNNSSQRRTPVARCLITPSVSTTLEMRIVSTTSGNSINPSVPTFDYIGTPWYSVISF